MPSNMGFLYPVFLIGAALVALPIVLHLLRRDVAPEVPFSAVRLLKKSPIERSRRRRLRDLLLLAARIVALLLLAAAFARPYVAGARSRLRIIAVDRSFSMSAPGVFDRALAQARAAVDGTALNDRIAVIAFDDRADLVMPPGSVADARAALVSLRPGFGATRYGSAIARAGEAAEGDAAELVVVTDLQRAGWDDDQPPIVPSNLHVAVSDVGEPPPNLAVVRIGTQADAVSAAIRNTGPAVHAGRVRAVVDGRAVATVPFSAPAASTIEVSIPYRPPSSGALTVSIDDPSGVAADNIRFAVLNPSPRPRAVVVTTAGAPGASGFYMMRALEAALPRDDGFDARVITGDELSAMGSDQLSEDACVVLLSTRGLDRHAREVIGAFVRRGGGLLITAASDVEPLVLSTFFDWQGAFAATEQAEPLALAATDLRHPIFRPFGALAANLGQVHFSRAWRVRPDGWDVAARFTDGSPALLERREGEGRVVLFASDVDRRWNDFPLHPAFVPFVLESVRHVARTSVRDREYLVGRAPAGAPTQPGFFRTQPRNQLMAVNVDPRESTAARLTPEEFEQKLHRVPAPAAGAATAAGTQTEARQNLWRYGLMLMLVTLVTEAFIGRA